MSDNELTNREDKVTMNSTLYESIRSVLLESRGQAYQTVNTAMLMAYWSVGKLIVEDEQNGQARAAYGKGVLTALSERLVKEFGAGFSVRNLQQMKKFYLLFPNTNAVRSQLSWTHYRALLRVESDDARKWYLEESIKN